MIFSYIAIDNIQNAAHTSAETSWQFNKVNTGNLIVFDFLKYFNIIFNSVNSYIIFYSRAVRFPSASGPIYFWLLYISYNRKKLCKHIINWYCPAYFRFIQSQRRFYTGHFGWTWGYKKHPNFFIFKSGLLDGFFPC